MTLQTLIDELREAQRQNYEAGVTITVLIDRLETLRDKTREANE